MKTYTRETDFVTKTVETANAHLGIANIEELGKAKASVVLVAVEHYEANTYPLQAPVDVSMIALEVSTSPKREVKRRRSSSSVVGWRPRM